MEQALTPWREISAVRRANRRQSATSPPGEGVGVFAGRQNESGSLLGRMNNLSGIIGQESYWPGIIGCVI